MVIAGNTKSDELSDLRKLFTTDGPFSVFGSIFEVKLILDANSVLADIRWLVCKARNPDARTSLMESIDAETILAYAPTYLEVEIQKNIPLMASEEGVDEVLFHEKWNIFKQKITFIDSGGPVVGEIDPKDAPYVNLHKETGYPVLSKDAHISKMGAKALGVEITTYAQNFSRNAVVEYKIKAGAIGTINISAALINAASDFLRSLAPALKNVPPWAWLMLLGLFAWAISLKGIRDWLQMHIEALAISSKKLGMNIFKLLEPYYLEHQEYKIKASAAKREVESKLNT